MIAALASLAGLRLFTGVIRDKEAINAMVCEVAGKNPAEANLTATAKVQKSIVQNWQPRYTAFPMQSYTQRGGITAMEAWDVVKDSFESE